MYFTQYFNHIRMSLITSKIIIIFFQYYFPGELSQRFAEQITILVYKASAKMSPFGRVLQCFCYGQNTSADLSGLSHCKYVLNKALLLGLKGCNQRAERERVLKKLHSSGWPKPSVQRKDWALALLSAVCQWPCPDPQWLRPDCRAQPSLARSHRHTHYTGSHTHPLIFTQPLTLD